MSERLTFGETDRSAVGAEDLAPDESYDTRYGSDLLITAEDDPDYGGELNPAYSQDVLVS